MGEGGGEGGCPSQCSGPGPAPSFAVATHLLLWVQQGNSRKGNSRGPLAVPAGQGGRLLGGPLRAQGGPCMCDPRR
jgi:hypothetical protein